MMQDRNPTRLILSVAPRFTGALNRSRSVCAGTLAATMCRVS
jgi:hypothetical protein